MYSKNLSALLLAAFGLIPQANADPLQLEVAEARARTNDLESGVAIDFKLKDPSAGLFSKFSRENIKKWVEVRVDGRVIMRARIVTSLDGGRGVLVSHLSLDEAEEMARRLSSGKAKLEVEPASN